MQTTQAMCSCRHRSRTRAAVLNVPYTSQWCGGSQCFRLKEKEEDIILGGKDFQLLHKLLYVIDKFE